MKFINRIIFTTLVIFTLLFVTSHSVSQVQAATKQCGDGFASNEPNASCPTTCPGVSYLGGVGICCGVVTGSGSNATCQAPAQSTPTQKQCGDGFASNENAVCPAACPGVPYVSGLGTCCGVVDSDGACQASTNPGKTTNPGNPSTNLSPSNVLSQDTINALNPIKLYSTNASDFLTPGTILSRVLVFAFPIAGLILFVMLIWAGFEILSGASDKKSLDNGRNRASAAIIGFILLFASYMIMQLIEIIFGIKVL